jgi:hypothetical protein
MLAYNRLIDARAGLKSRPRVYQAVIGQQIVKIELKNAQSRGYTDSRQGGLWQGTRVNSKV